MFCFPHGHGEVMGITPNICKLACDSLRQRLQVMATPCVAITSVFGKLCTESRVVENPTVCLRLQGLSLCSVSVYAVYAGAGLFHIAAVPNGSEYPPEHRIPLCVHCDWCKYMTAVRQACHYKLRFPYTSR